MDSDIKSTDFLLPSDEALVTTRSQPRRVWLQHSLSVLLGLLPAFIVWLLMIRTSHAENHEIYASPIPTFPLETRVFQWNYTFTALRTPSSEEAWSSLVPVCVSIPPSIEGLSLSNIHQFGRGYVFIADPEAYSLPPGEAATSGGQIYSVALYHQLHCLSVIRRDYFNLLEGVWHNETESTREEAFKQIDNDHNRHCMDYIRQTLECNADMTIEWERTETDGTRFQVDGMNIPHVCKRRTSVTEFMTEQMLKVEEERGKFSGL